ncbi:hypothetical protein DCAR_0415899 [Daucus carota subsp. sativus]|uniref:Uncharacterized protein n=1 Tax=Daucus carota subsp. sativus TaxID=79200 RepID=A0A165WW28_DAUCS|nr:hypothetical protein DCAR_0415899 [Daucus carota subsp. sativus]
MDAVASHIMLQCAFNSCLSMSDMEIKRRPYHRNCNCALHKPKDSHPAACFRHGNVAFSTKLSWTDCSITLSSPKISSQSLFVRSSSASSGKGAYEPYEGMYINMI